MTTFRIYESRTGQFVGRADGGDASEAIAVFAGREGESADSFHALVEPGRGATADSG